MRNIEERSAWEEKEILDEYLDDQFSYYRACKEAGKLADDSKIDFLIESHGPVVTMFVREFMSLSSASDILKIYKDRLVENYKEIEELRREEQSDKENRGEEDEEGLSYTRH